MYVHVSLGEKKECWDSLNLFLNQHNLENLVVGGDLNITLALAEKKRGIISSGSGKRVGGRLDDGMGA